MFGDKKFMNQQKNKIERLNQVEKGKKKKKDAFVDWKAQLWAIFRISNNWHGLAKPGPGSAGRAHSSSLGCQS